MSKLILAGLILLAKVYAVGVVLWLAYMLYLIGWHLLDWFRPEPENNQRRIDK